MIDAPGKYGYLASLLFNYLLGLSISFIVCFVGGLCRRIHEYAYRCWHLVFHVIFYAYSISNLFLITLFQIRWNAFTFQLINETNSREVGDFFSCYSNSWQFVMSLFILCLFLVVEYFWMRHNVNDLRHKLIIAKRIWSCAIVISLCLFFYETPCYSLEPSFNNSHSDKLIRRNGLWNLYQSVLLYQADAELIDVCIKSQNDLRITSCNYTSKNLILIIGETFNRHHSSLYGYGLDTNPHCRDLNGYIFKNVISPINGTTSAFKYFLSFSDTQDSLRWCDTPLFPALFKAVGYNVVFYSNQYAVEGNVDFYDASAGYFNHPKVYSKLFNHRNHQRYDNDMKLVDDFKQKQNELSDTLNLFIFHLCGQHSPAVERFPKEFAHFTSADIPRSDLDEKQRQYIADYDNATLYNDSVVVEIVNLFEDKDAIILYFADHGEEVYDCRDKAGRFFDFQQGGKDVVRNQLDIPFWIFATDLYKKGHTDLISAVESATELPFMTDDFPYIMLWLSGIESDWYQGDKCLFDPQFDYNRKRIIALDNIDYDAFK